MITTSHSQGIDELVLIKLWKENATTEVRNKALEHTRS